MSKLMVPLDGSLFAEQALPLAIALARAEGVGVHLVQVRGTEPIDLRDGQPYVDWMRNRIEEEVAGGVTSNVIDESDVRHYPPPAAGAIADALARYMDAHEIELVVMATHGRGGVRRVWLGSVTDAFIRISTRPVLLVRPDEEPSALALSADRGVDQILVPLDSSKSALSVLAHAERLASAFGARITLLRVLSPWVWEITDATRDAYSIAETSPLHRQAALAALEQIARPMRERGVAVGVRVIDSASAASAILEFATDHGMDLIALATQGAGGVRRLLLGSTADKIVRAADVPVLVCNARTVAREEGEPLATHQVAGVT